MLQPGLGAWDGADPHTGFAHAAATGDGRFVVTYSTGDSLQLAVEAPGAS